METKYRLKIIADDFDVERAPDKAWIHVFRELHPGIRATDLARYMIHVAVNEPEWQGKIYLGSATSVQKGTLRRNPAKHYSSEDWVPFMWEIYKRVARDPFILAEQFPVYAPEVYRYLKHIPVLVREVLGPYYGTFRQHSSKHKNDPLPSLQEDKSSKARGFVYVDKEHYLKIHAAINSLMRGEAVENES